MSTDALFPTDQPRQPRRCRGCHRPVPVGPTYDGYGESCAGDRGLIPRAVRLPTPRTAPDDNEPNLLDLINNTKELTMRRFQLVRTADITGVSGTGVVADGCQFEDGKVAIRWRGERPSTVVWDRIEDALHVHGHAGSTQFRWLDDANNAVASLDPTTVWVIPKIPVDAGWLTRDGRRVSVMSPLNEDDFSPAEAREFAASYLAAADEAERREAAK